MSTPRKGSMILAASVFIALVLLISINRMTHERIAQAQQRLLMHSLDAVLPEGPFDQNPAQSVREHQVMEPGGEKTLKLYTAYRNAEPVAAALEVIAPDGYSGDITLLLGLLVDGSIVGVRVVDHQETPGLGDRIEHRKSAWITQFDGQSIVAGAPADWQSYQAREQYDALTGATITSRAVVQSIQRAVQWFDTHHDEVFSQ